MKIIVKMFLLLSISIPAAFAQLDFDQFFVSDSATVGGDLVFYLYDQTKGRGDTTGDNDASAGIKNATLYIRKELSDRLTVQIDPEIRVTAGATPKIGQDIDRSTETETEVEFLNAFVSYRFDNDITVKAGLFKPFFTWEYGHELFWNEHFHGSQTAANPWLGSWTDSGIEIYKNFDFNSFSLPTSLYILNGPGHEYVDNNEGRSILFHIEPEFMGGALKFLASYGFGKYDDDNEKDFNRYALGVSITYKNLAFRTEYMGGSWDDQFMVFQTKLADIKPKGYYAKIIYHFAENFNTVISYNKAEHDFTGFFFTATDNDETYEDIILSFNYIVDKAMTIMCSFDRLKAENDIDGSLEYDRITLGSRITF